MKPLKSIARHLRDSHRDHVAPQPSRVTDAILATGTATFTIGINALAFWLSYEHLHDVAATNGLSGARAWAWPGTVDLFIALGELLTLRAQLKGASDKFAYVLTAVGSIGSIVLNVMGVGEHADTMNYVVAAVPPTAALIGFWALMRQVHARVLSHHAAPAATVAPATAATTPPQPAVAPVTTTTSHATPQVATHVAPVAPDATQHETATPATTVSPIRSHRDEAHVTIPEPAQPSHGGRTADQDDATRDLAHEIDEAMRPVTQAHDGATLLTTKEVADLKGVARSTVSNWKLRDQLAPYCDDPLLFHPDDVARAPMDNASQWGTKPPVSHS